MLTMFVRASLTTEPDADTDCIVTNLSMSINLLVGLLQVLVLPDGFEHMRKYEVPDVNHRLALSFSLDKFRGYLEAAGAEGSVRDQHIEESA